jgi:hypothetical protein
MTTAEDSIAAQLVRHSAKGNCMGLLLLIIVIVLLVGGLPHGITLATGVTVPAGS